MIPPERVFSLLEKHMGGVFRWGKEDCFISGASVFHELTGLDLAVSVRGKYSSEEGARVLLDPYGGSLSRLVEVWTNRLSLPQGVGEPSPGAIGVSPRECAIGLDGRCVCIYLGNGLWATKAIRGFSLGAKAERFWNA